MSTAPVGIALPTLDRLDWPALEAWLDESGFAMTPPLLTPEQCAEVRDMFGDHERFRSTVVMARHAYGEGSYRYFADPLPPLVQCLRTALYPPTARIANRWADRLGERHYPEDLDGLLGECAGLGQHKPTPLVLRYGPGGYNCLHQDVYGDLTFPLQLLIMLSTPGRGLHRRRERRRPRGTVGPAAGAARGRSRSASPARSPASRARCTRGQAAATADGAGTPADLDRFRTGHGDPRYGRARTRSSAWGQPATRCSCAARWCCLGRRRSARSST
jgi:hypothetical protein